MTRADTLSYANPSPIGNRFPDDGNAINLRNVTKIYRRKVHALAGISMNVRRGEIFGLLGPNGAGKSTLVKIMMTVVRPTRAEGTILGLPVGHKPTLRRVGYLPENHRFPRYLTGRQVVEFFSALAMVDRRTRRRRSAEMLQTVSMHEWADTRIGQYSKGMLQRIGLATAMSADPDLIVLDEPTDGVDPAGRRDIRDVLLRLRREGKTVFVNSHLLSELETVCDRVAILVQGRVARQGTLDELTLGKQFYQFDVSAEEGIWPKIAAAFPGVFDAQQIAARSAAIPPAREGAIPTLGYMTPGVATGGAPGTPPPLPGAHAPALRGQLADQTWIDFDGKSLRIEKTDPADVQGMIDALRKQGIVIRRIQLFRPTLEDMFMEAVGGTNLVMPGHSAMPGNSVVPGGDRK
jgi:ABC-2 type transport system ATP-binding protein